MSDSKEKETKPKAKAEGESKEKKAAPKKEAKKPEAKKAAPAKAEKPEVKEAKDTRDILFIYKDRCLSCLHLCANGTEEYSECHYTQGNTDCPASKTRIVVGVNIQRTAEAITKALNGNDVEQLAKVFKRLSRRDPVVVERVMAELKSKGVNVPFPAVAKK